MDHAGAVASATERQLGTFLAPLLSRLDLGSDRRLVRTVARTVVAIISL